MNSSWIDCCKMRSLVTWKEESHSNISCVFALLSSFIMVALYNRADHYIFILWFLLLSSSFFFPCCVYIYCEEPTNDDDVDDDEPSARST